MVKRPMDTPTSPAARLDGSAGTPRAGVPPKSGDSGGDAPGPILAAGWKLFGPMPRAWSIVILAAGAWLVLALIAVGLFGFFR